MAQDTVQLPAFVNTRMNFKNRDFSDRVLSNSEGRHYIKELAN
jgi:hypothetical protein